jgi:hypothetical protein
MSDPWQQSRAPSDTHAWLGVNLRKRRGKKREERGGERREKRREKRKRRKEKKDCLLYTSPSPRDH